MRSASAVVIAATIVVLTTAVWAQAPVQQQQVWVGRGEALRPAQTFFGPTGALQTPTAQVVGDKRWQVGYHYLQQERGSTNFHVPKVTVGVGSHMEVSVAYAHADGYDDLCPLALREPFDVEDGGHVVASAKIVLQQERGSGPGVAVGCLDIANEIGLTAYAVASKTLFENSLLPVTFSGGVASSNRILDDAFWSVGFHPMRRFDLLVEHTGYCYNLGARWWPWRSVLIDAGWQHLMDSQYYAGVSYLGRF